MKTNKLFGYFLVSAVLMLLTSFIQPDLVSASKPDVSGKWYYRTSAVYYKSTDRSDIGRWYDFKSNSRVQYSTCTDWCGCMRVTYSGKYEWENDSIISITFNKEKREMSGVTHELDEKIYRRIKVTQAEPKGLIIQDVRKK